MHPTKGDAVPFGIAWYWQIVIAVAVIYLLRGLYLAATGEPMPKDEPFRSKLTIFAAILFFWLPIFIALIAYGAWLVENDRTNPEAH